MMNNNISITLQPLGIKIYVEKGTPLIDVLHEYGVEFPCGGKGSCGACSVKLLEGELPAGSVQQEKLKKLGLGEEWRLACYCRAESDITLEVSQFENIILADNTAFKFNPRSGYGVVVDLGTTTVVTQLVNLENGHILDSVSDVNPQWKYGSDLITRIEACLDGKQEEMQDLIRKKTGSMIGQMLKKHPVKVVKAVVVGNTAMHHIFSGLDTSPLSMYPFESPHLGFVSFDSSELGWDLPAECENRFYPSIGSFVGSDILAGIAATRMLEKEEYTVLIDLGTNGEIVAGNCDGLLCASTAAGPAFEGAKISQGMRATTGAISSVVIENGRLDSHVIGNVPAQGICGSGLVDIMAILLNEERIGMFGEINSGEEKIELAPGVYLTQQDIREFQLAKAAIATGVQVLFNQLKIGINELEKVYIAGGFGNFLNTGNIVRTGLIETNEEKIVKFGNTALIGAKMFLFDDDDKVQEILEKTRHVNLEGDACFQDIYVDKMMMV